MYICLTYRITFRLAEQVHLRLIAKYLGGSIVEVQQEHEKAKKQSKEIEELKAELEKRVAVTKGGTKGRRRRMQVLEAERRA